MASTKYTNKLAGKKVLIIGGTSGLGYGVAEAILEHGGRVVLSSSSTSKLSNTVAKLEAAYPSAKGRISTHACNLGGADAAEQVAALMSAAAPSAGELLDHIVYTAGDSLPIRALGEWDVAGMQAAGMVRFFGPVLVAQHAATALKPGPDSSIVLTNGAVADRPRPNWVVAAGYMAGLYGLTRGLALDLAPRRVNCVCPGAVDTELWDPIRDAGNYDQLVKTFKDGSMTGEVGRVEDVVEAYLYLLRDRNATGTIVSTNSGALLK